MEETILDILDSQGLYAAICAAAQKAELHAQLLRFAMMVNDTAQSGTIGQQSINSTTSIEEIVLVSVLAASANKCCQLAADTNTQFSIDSALPAALSQHADLFRRMFSPATCRYLKHKMIESVNGSLV